MMIFLHCNYYWEKVLTDDKLIQIENYVSITTLFARQMKRNQGYQHARQGIKKVHTESDWFAYSNANGLNGKLRLNHFLKISGHKDKLYYDV